MHSDMKNNSNDLQESLNSEIQASNLISIEENKPQQYYFSSPANSKVISSPLNPFLDFNNQHSFSSNHSNSQSPAQNVLDYPILQFPQQERIMNPYGNGLSTFAINNDIQNSNAETSQINETVQSQTYHLDRQQSFSPQLFHSPLISPLPISYQPHSIHNSPLYGHDQERLRLSSDLLTRSLNIDSSSSILRTHPTSFDLASILPNMSPHLISSSDNNHHRPTIYQCSHSHCRMQYSSYNLLMAHIRKHEQEKYYECERCQSVFRRAFDLKRHIKSIHDIKTIYKCQVCDKQFSRLDALRRHVKRPKSVCSAHNFDTHSAFSSSTLDEKRKG